MIVIYFILIIFFDIKTLITLDLSWKLGSIGAKYLADALKINKVIGILSFIYLRLILFSILRHLLHSTFVIVHVEMMELNISVNF